MRTPIHHPPSNDSKEILVQILIYQENLEHPLVIVTPCRQNQNLRKSNTNGKVKVARLKTTYTSLS
jgi:hypothetical protein